MGSVDIPPFLREQQKKSAGNIPPFLKKKEPEESQPPTQDLSNGTTETSPLSLPSQSTLQGDNPFSNPFSTFQAPPKTSIVEIGGKKVDLEKTAPLVVADPKLYAENLKQKIQSKIPLSEEEFTQVKSATGFDDDLTTLALNEDPNFTAVKTVKDRENKKSSIVDYLSSQDGNMMVIGVDAFPKGQYVNYDLEDKVNVEKLFTRFESDKKEYEAKAAESNPFNANAKAASSWAAENLKAGSPFMQTYNNLKDWKAQQVAERLVKDGVTDAKQAGIAIQQATDAEKTEKYWKSHAPDVPTGIALLDGIRSLSSSDTPVQDYDLENTGANYLKQALTYEAARKKLLGEDNNKDIEDFVKVEKAQSDLYAKYPDVRYGQIVATISDAKASEEGLANDTDANGIISRVGYQTTGEDVIRIAKEKGLYNSQLDKELVDKIAGKQEVNPMISMFVPAYGLIKKVTAPIENVSFVGQFTEGVRGVIENTGKSIVDLAQLRGNNKISAEQYNDDVITSWKKDQSNLDDTQKTIALVGNTTGQIVGQGLTTLAFSGIGKAAGLAQNSIENLGFWASGALSSYEDGKKSMLDITGSDVKAEAGALLIGFYNAATEKMFKDTKVFGDVFGKRVGNILKNIDEDKLFTQATRSEVTKALQSDLAQWGKNFVVEGQKEGFEEFSTAVLQDVTEAVLGDNKKFDITKTWENARDTYVSTLIGGSLAAGKAAYTDIRINPNAATSLYHAAQNPNYYISSIQELQNKNQISPSEANKKIQLINNAVVINNEITQLDEGLNARQKAAYVSYRATQAQLQELSTKTTDGTLKAKLDENIKILDEQKDRILNGLQFNEKLQPLNNLYDKEQAVRQAQQVADETQTPESIDALEKAKIDYANDIVNYYTPLQNESTQAQQPTTENTEAANIEVTATETDNTEAQSNPVGQEVGVITPETQVLLDEVKDNPVFTGMNDKQRIRFVAEQAQNISPTGEKLEGDAYLSTVEKFGDKLVTAAIEMFPEETLTATQTTAGEQEQISQPIELSTEVGQLVPNAVEPSTVSSEVIEDIYFKTSDELNTLRVEAKEREKQKLIDAVGEDWYKKYSLATNSEKSKMEDALTPEQKKVFGGEGVLDKDNPELLQNLKSKIQSVESASDANELGVRVRDAITDLANGRNKKESLAVLNAASRKADELGVSKKEIQDAAIRDLREQLGDTDAKSILDTYFSKSENKPLTSEQDTKASTESTQRQSAEETQPTTTVPIEVSQTAEPKTYKARAKVIADNIRNAELPSWMGSNAPNIQANGVTINSLKNALADAVELVGQLLDKGVELKDAIAQGLNSLKKVYNDNNVPFDDKTLTDGFTGYAEQQFPNYQSIKDLAEEIRKDIISYNDAIGGKNQEYIDSLNKELFGSKKFNFDVDAFKAQVRKQKSFGLSEAEVIQVFEASKKLTKAQKALIAEIFGETAETDKIAKELQEAFNKLAQGEKPKAVLERLSVSHVTELVNALKDALTYKAVSNDQLEKMADYIVDTIDLSKADQYLNALISNSVADVRQLLRAKLIIALQKEGNRPLATQLIKDMADEATLSGRQTQSLGRAYEILGAQGNPSTRAEFARRSAEAVQKKAAQMTEGYAQVISEQEVEIGRLNERLHKKAQESSLINKIKDVISNLCGLRNKK